MVTPLYSIMIRLGLVFERDTLRIPRPSPHVLRSLRRWSGSIFLGFRAETMYISRVFIADWQWKIPKRKRRRNDLSQYSQQTYIRIKYMYACMYCRNAGNLLHLKYFPLGTDVRRKCVTSNGYLQKRYDDRATYTWSSAVAWSNSSRCSSWRVLRQPLHVLL